MYRDKIRAHHLARTAFVYLRQSSPTQVKHNVEGKKRQLHMQDKIRQLGWPDSQIHLLDGDTGNSGSSLHGRDDYHIMFEAVLEQTAGIIGARELSRLVRDNQDWNQLVRVCRYQDVLLCDEYRVYDPTDPQDRVMLGIQGAFNEFELAMIIDRMQESRRQKAKRGELYEGFPPGYICRRPPLLEKHPDRRVQRAIERVFQEFEGVPSASALRKRLLAEGFQLPVVPRRQDWREVQWITPSYEQLLGMLQNPAYAGIYVRGRTKTVTELDENGHAFKRQRRVPREEWDVFIEEHHEPYIRKATWEQNVKKIQSNVHWGGMITKRSPGNGSSLLTGLLRCRRCGHKLQVRYSSSCSTGRYECRSGARRRDSVGPICFSFAAQRVENRVTELLLEVVGPAGIDAARLAAEQLATEHQKRRTLIVDCLGACREIEARAAREYKATDETYAAVREKLAEEWDQALQAVHAEEQRLAEFDVHGDVTPTREQLDQLQRLGSDLRRVWFHPQASMVLKKQIVRTLIEEVVVDVDPEGDEIVLWIHWSGGHHTELRQARRGRRRRMKVDDLKAVIETLRKVLADESIASVLNRERIPTLQGDSWSKSRVQAFRRRNKIRAFSERGKLAQGWLTQAEAATRLEISPMSISRLVKAGNIPAERPREGLPSVIREHDLSLPEVQHAAHRLKSINNRPLPTDPNQLSLFPTTDS